MFKSGDDLRQDQLIMQMISLMDRLLKKVNSALKLLTYGILAVGQKDGTFSLFCVCCLTFLWHSKLRNSFSSCYFNFYDYI